MWCCVRRKARLSLRNWHCSCLATSLWNCSINPHCLSLEVKSKYSAIHLCCSFGKEFMFYMGGAVSKGPRVVPDSNESIHTSGLLFMLTDSSSSSSSSSSKHAKAKDTDVHIHTPLQDKERSEINRHAHTHIKHIFFTLYKSYMSCTLEGLLTFNRFQTPFPQTKDGSWKGGFSSPFKR